MNKHQFRAIRSSFFRDMAYIKGSGYGGEGTIDFPIMRKKIEDVSFRGKKVTKHDLLHSYTLWKGKNVYKKYTINTGRSSDIYVITLNDRIIYWCSSPISAPVWAAWRILTEVFHGYGTDMRNGCWTWKSHEDFDCIDHFWDRHDPEFNKNWYYHTEYQKEMYKKTSKYYIDKEIVDKSIIEPLFAKEYYHT